MNNGFPIQVTLDISNPHIFSEEMSWTEHGIKSTFFQSIIEILVEASGYSLRKDEFQSYRINFVNWNRVSDGKGNYVRVYEEVPTSEAYVLGMRTNRLQQ